MHEESAIGTLADRTVVVTGGATGIGRAICRKIARHGGRVAALDIDPSGLAALRTELESIASPDSLLLVAGDATSPDDVASFFAQVTSRLGIPYGLVNNVGGPVVRCPFLELTLEELDRTLDLNFRSMFLCSRSAAQLMVDAGEGRIVNISTLAAERALPRMSAYGAAKAAVVALSRSMAIELAPHKIAVNAVAPGHVDTEAAIRLTPADLRAARNRVIPTQEHVDPEDLASVVVFLLEEAGRNLTGTVVSVDGGMMAAMPRPLT